jgi:hypothetical protein
MRKLMQGSLPQQGRHTGLPFPSLTISKKKMLLPLSPRMESLPEVSPARSKAEIWYLLPYRTPSGFSRAIAQQQGATVGEEGEVVPWPLS